MFRRLCIMKGRFCKGLINKVEFLDFVVNNIKCGGWKINVLTRYFTKDVQALPGKNS